MVSEMKFECYGSNGDLTTYYCYDLLERVAKKAATPTEEPTEGEAQGEEKAAEPAAPVEGVEVEFKTFLEIEYVKKLRGLQTDKGGAFLHHKVNHIVVLDGEYFGGIDEVKALAADKYDIKDTDEYNTVYYGRLQREEFASSVKGLGTLTYMEFEDGSRMRDASTPEYGKIIIELFEKTVPLACQNFRLLCTGELGATELAKLHFQGCPVHRVVQGGWFQAGDIVSGNGTGSYAAIGDGRVQDESFVTDFGNPLGGMVGYSTSSAHSNGSQFFVTLGPCEWMNGSYVGVGRVVQGFDVLEKINNCEVSNQKPAPPILCAKSGIQNV